MDRHDERADQVREVACTLLRLARSLLEWSSERIVAAEVTLLIGQLEVEPQARPGRREDMCEILIPRSSGRI